MARSIKPATRLTRLFSIDGAPLYILSTDGTITFANDMLGIWLDVDTHSLIGRQVVFGGPTVNETEDSAIAGLAPPPDVYYGTTVRTSISKEVTNAETGDTSLIYREVRFTPILPCEKIDGNPAVPLAVVATVGTKDLDEPILPAPEASEVSQASRHAIELHERVRSYRLSIACRRGTDVLLGESPAARLARSRFGIATSSSANTLIVGPLGSGRRQLAEAVYYTSNVDGPLIPLACPLLDDRLPSIVSETLEENADATLLLLDVDQMDPSVANRLFERLVELDRPPQIIGTAESIDPSTSALPADLVGLLSTIVIELPALAQRRDDLPVLIQAIVESTSEDIDQANGPNGERSKRTGVDEETLETLTGYGWPGDYAELVDTIAEAYDAASGPTICMEDLSQHFRTRADASLRPVRPIESIDLDQMVDSIRKELVARALGMAKGNKAAAARLLGLTRPRLYRYVEQYELDDSDPAENETGHDHPTDN